MQHAAEMAERLSAVRAGMSLCRREGGVGVDAFLIPSADDHQSEYVPAMWARRSWVSGFDGSAGDAVVTRETAGLWTDGRYWLQAERQLGPGWTLFRQGAAGVPTWAEWLASRPAGTVVGVDPRTVSWRVYEELSRELSARGLRLVGVEENPVDGAWKDRPAPPRSAVTAHALEFAGASAAEKLAALRGALGKAGADGHLVTTLDAAAWLFNLRGSDVPFNPVFVAYAVVTAERAVLFTDVSRVSEGARASLAGAAELAPYEDFARVVREETARGRRWWVDAEHTSRWAASLCGEGSIAERGRSPVLQAKSRKNEVELRGMRAAHRRDAAALARFLRWIEREVGRGAAVDEVSAARALRAERERTPGYKGDSFDAISGYGPNGAVIHYRPTAETCLPIGRAALYLIDSGGQYEDGTTDVTRTLHFGEASASQRERFTRVLKGHIALARARFPRGARGMQLDMLARQFLWEAGMEYQHGTGHGVGAAMSVHEYPPNVSARPVATAPMEPGNVVSDEPGHYVDGQDGIRIENLLAVREVQGGWMEFEVLTLAPIQRSLIAREMLTPTEERWVDEYHARVAREVGPLLEGEDRAWLERATRPLAQG